MAKIKHYDFFVIGAGSAGVRASRIAAGHGAKVGIAEGRDLGGTCVNRGCVPKKLMVYSSQFSKAFQDASAFGWKTFGLRWFDWRRLTHNINAELRRLNGIYKNLLNNASVEIHNGYASFKDAHTLIINNETITADNILIATGGKPRVPEIEGKEHLLTSDDVFEMSRLPKKVVVIGGGYIAVEFACILKNMGCDVTLMNRSEGILRGFDEDMRQWLLEEMTNKGIHMHFNCAPERVGKKGGKTIIYTNKGTEITCDAAIAAIGRDTNIDALKLENAGVITTASGKFETDKNNRTNVPHIFALGDISNNDNLTPVAIEEGHALADRLFANMADRYVDYENIPTAVFSDPPIGTVGMTEQEVRDAGIEYTLYKASFRPMKNTLSGRQEKTYMKLIVCEKTEKLLGVHMLGDDAPEIIQMVGVILKMNGTKSDLDRTIGVHPTAAEEFVTMRTASPK
jgi:glutathione reductase (NADPH)